LAATEQVTPTPAASAPVSVARINNSTTHVGGVSFDRRVLTLLAMGCLVGVIAGWVSGGPREPRLRLLSKAKKTRLSVLVLPGPAPRLIPSDSPNATRARWARASASRQTPDGATRPGIVDYLAVFAGSAEGSEGDRVDYLLESTDSASPTTEFSSRDE
jgi:hypothetical protein